VKGVPHLLERGVGDLEITAVGSVARQAYGRHDELEDEVGIFGVGLLDEGGDGGVELGVTGPVAGASGHPPRV